MRYAEREREREQEEQRKREEEKARRLKKEKERQARLEKIRKKYQEKKKKQAEETKKIITKEAMKLGWILQEKSPGKFVAIKGNDRMEIETMTNGLPKITTGKISLINHASGDFLISNIAKGLNAVWKIFSRKGVGAVHAHMHEHHHIH